MSKNITIVTRLHPDMTKGGVAFVERTYATGPRNLLKAISELTDVRKANIRNCGNIGCGRTWLEIGGQWIHDFDLQDVVRDDAVEFGDLSLPVKTRTEKAREMIATALAGQYDEKRYDFED